MQRITNELDGQGSSLGNAKSGQEEKKTSRNMNDGLSWMGSGVFFSIKRRAVEKDNFVHIGTTRGSRALMQQTAPLCASFRSQAKDEIKRDRRISDLA